MQDIPASSLSSLPSRISYTRSFLEFSAEDAAALHAARPVLAPLVPVIVDMVYVKLFDYNITAQSFVPKQTGFTGSSPESLEDLKLDHPQILFRKDFLKGYIAKLVTLDYEDIKTWEYLDKVALMHTGVEFSGFKHRAKKPGLRVEYVHCGLLLGYVEDIIISEVIKHPELSPETKLVVTRAVNKLLWLQNDLFARHYIQDKDEGDNFLKRLAKPSTLISIATACFCAAFVTLSFP